MARISMKLSVTVAETLADFILSRKAKGLSEKTLITYNQHFAAIGKHLSPDIPIDKIGKEDLELMITSISSDTIKSITAREWIIKAFN